MRIQHNIIVINAYRNYGNNTGALSKNLEKLSSGYRINRAGDDAAGLAISEKMRAQIQGLNAAQKNVKDAISFVKTDEGAMQEIQDMLSRMKYLATQSANGTYENDVDRKALQDEVDSLLEKINRIADSANFNDIHMLNGGEGGDDEGGSVISDDLREILDDIITDAATSGFTDGDSTNSSEKNATFEIDFDGVTFEKAGAVVVTLGGNDYEVEVTKGMDGEGFAAALAEAYDKGTAIKDNDAGKFSAEASGTKITFTSAAQSALDSGTLFNDLAIKAKPSVTFDDEDDDLGTAGITNVDITGLPSSVKTVTINVVENDESNGDAGVGAEFDEETGELTITLTQKEGTSGGGDNFAGVYTDAEGVVKAINDAIQGLGDDFKNAAFSADINVTKLDAATPFTDPISGEYTPVSGGGTTPSRCRSATAARAMTR